MRRRGVWRNEASYVYDVPRSASETVNIAKDGTFDLEMFNWEQADLERRAPLDPSQYHDPIQPIQLRA